MRILPETNTPYTLAELEANFDRICDPTDWRNPIYAVLPKAEIQAAFWAIQYFTGGAKIEIYEADGDDMFSISSPGYRLGPCGA